MVEYCEDGRPGDCCPRRSKSRIFRYVYLLVLINPVVQMAAIPQCIQAANQLYNLRERYKDASVLITAIYSESMVIAASLTQVQGLLKREPLDNRPELFDTFDRAVIGCRVVCE